MKWTNIKNKLIQTLLTVILITTAMFAHSETDPLHESMVNLAPVVCKPLVNQSAQSNSLFTLLLPDNLFFDPENEAISYNVLLADGKALPDWLTYNQTTRTLSGTPTKAKAGSLTLKVIGKDPGGLTAEQSFTLTVIVASEAPIINRKLADQSTDQYTLWQFTFPVDTFIDPDNGLLTYAATLADNSVLPAWLTFNPETRTFSGTAGLNDHGLLNIKITATNPQKLSATQQIKLTINYIDQAPSVSQPLTNQAVNQRTLWRFILPENAFTDPGGSRLTYQVTLTDGNPLPGWLTFNPSTLMFVGTPENAGRLDFRVTVTNSYGLTASQVFSLTINKVDTPPSVINSIPHQTTRVGQDWRWRLPDNIFKSNVPDARLTLSVYGLPAWLSFDANSQTFSGYPDNNNYAHAVTILVRATNSAGLSAETAFILTINRASDTLDPGTNLYLGQRLISSDNRYHLILQTNGDLVFYDERYNGLWSSNTAGSGANRAAMQPDGNLVLYTANNQAVWQSNTSGRGPSHLSVQSDGNLVIYQQYRTIWYTATAVANAPANVAPGILASGQTLYPDQYVANSDDSYRLKMESNGVLALWRMRPTPVAIWMTFPTVGHFGAKAVMQDDGNLVVYASNNVPLWQTFTNGQYGAFIYVQNDGNVVMYRHTPTWAKGQLIN